VSINEASEKIFFIENGIKQLPRELARPFTRISIVYLNKPSLEEKKRWASSITLWDSNDEGVRISATINDVADRVEVGSLSFEKVTKANEGDEFFELSESFSNGTLLSKVILHESRKYIETGIIITAPNEAQIMIVPNAMPYTLAVRCEEVGAQFFEPEYPLEEYVIESWDWKKGSESV